MIVDGKNYILKSRIKHRLPPVDYNVAKFLLNSFELHSDRILVVDSGIDKREFTGRYLSETVKRIATNLIKKVKLKPTDIVMTLCEHDGNELLIAFGIIVAGCSLFGSNISDGISEWQTYCQLLKPDVIVCDSNISCDVMKLIKSLPQLKSTKLIFIGDIKENIIKDEDNIFTLNDLVEDDSVMVDDELINEIINKKINDKEDAIGYLLTSGSTGRPKLVPATHEEFLHILYSLISTCENPLINKSSDSNNIVFPLTKNDIIAGDLPLDHAAGFLAMLLSIYVGSKLIIMPSYQEDIFWQNVNDHRITISVSGTTFTFKLLSKLKYLIDSGETNKWDLNCFKMITCCGSKMTFTDLANEVRKFYKNLIITQCYGATEIGYMTMLNPQDAQRNYLNSVGHLLPGMIAKVVDINTNKLCGPNERGQLHIFAKSKFKQYICHKDDNKDDLFANCHDSDGFYITGDQVHYDEEERFYVHGRFKDTLYLMEDWKILPAELEDVINLHPLVDFSIVVGIPDKDLPGCHAPKAFIKLKSIERIDLERKSCCNNDVIDGQNYNNNNNDDDNFDQLYERLQKKDYKFIEDDIYKFTAQRTASPKHLKGGVRILEEFPIVGLLKKIDRKVLKLMD